MKTIRTHECIYTLITTTGSIVIISLGCHWQTLLNMHPAERREGKCCGFMTLLRQEVREIKDRESYKGHHSPSPRSSKWSRQPRAELNCPELRRYKRPSCPCSTRQWCEIPYQDRSSNSRSPGELALMERSAASRCRCQDKYSFQYVRYRYSASGKAVLVASTRKQGEPGLCLPREGEAVENNKAVTSG